MSLLEKIYLLVVIFITRVKIKTLRLPINKLCLSDFITVIDE